MAKELLTARMVRLIKTPGVYNDGRVLRLIVTAKGAKRWELFIPINRRRRERGLGLFPDVSLQDARNEADKIRRAARKGIDLRQHRRDAQANAVTFRQAFETYFSVKCKQLSNAKHLKQWPRTMETYVYPVFGDVPVAEVTTVQVLDALTPKLKPRSNKPANRLDFISGTRDIDQEGMSPVSTCWTGGILGYSLDLASWRCDRVAGYSSPRASWPRSHLFVRGRWPWVRLMRRPDFRTFPGEGNLASTIVPTLIRRATAPASQSELWTPLSF